MTFEFTELVEARDRFENFYDGFIEAWRYGSDERGVNSGPTLKRNKDFLEFSIQSQDKLSLSGWSLVTIRMVGCKSIVLYSTNSAHFSILSFGLHLLQGEGLVGVEFGDYFDPPSTMDELKKSRFHVVAETLVWDASPLP